MQSKTMIGVTLGVLLFLGGCGESSVLEWMGDDNSPAARRAAAQRALDKADCHTAVNLFSGLFDQNPGNIDRRLDLAAAYLCQAGFSVQGLLSIVADFSKDKEGTKGTLFQKITGAVATVIPNAETWQASVCSAKDLLGDLENDGKPDAWPCTSARDEQKNVKFFNNDPDAGYILTIVNLADATLAIADALKTVDGITQCITTKTATSTSLSNDCKITTEDLTSVGNSLLAALQSASDAGPGGDLFRTADNLVFNANTNKDNQISPEEILNYLVDQKIINPNNLKDGAIPQNCNFTQGKYICT